MQCHAMHAMPCVQCHANKQEIQDMFEEIMHEKIFVDVKAVTSVVSGLSPSKCWLGFNLSDVTTNVTTNVTKCGQMWHWKRKKVKEMTRRCFKSYKNWRFLLKARTSPSCAVLRAPLNLLRDIDSRWSLYKQAICNFMLHVWPTIKKRVKDIKPCLDCKQEAISTQEKDSVSFGIYIYIHIWQMNSNSDEI